MLDCKSCYWYRPKQGRERYDRCRYFKGERQLILGTEAHAGCKHFYLRANGAPIRDPPAFYDPRFQDD